MVKRDEKQRIYCFISSEKNELINGGGLGETS